MHRWFRALALFLLAGCPAASEDVRPPESQMFFPTALVMSEGDDVLFAANSNANRVFSAGSILAFDVASVRDVVRTWSDSQQIPSGRDCEPDVDLPSVLVCDESEFVLADATTRLGNFASDLKTQELLDGRTRLFATVRGDPSVTWLDWNSDTSSFECGGGNELVQKCDAEHRLATIRDDLEVGLIPPEPFGLFVDGTNGYAAISDLRLGSLTLADAPQNGAAPSLTDTLGGIFTSQSSVTRAIGIAGRRPGTQGDRLYLTSGSENRVQTFTVTRHGGFPILVPAEYFFLNGVAGSSDARGIVFSQDGDRAHIINRSPPALHIIDTSIGELGIPRNETLNIVELCPTSSSVSVDTSMGVERTFVNCFSLGQIWIIDPENAAVVSIVDVGQGPYDIEIDTIGQLLFVTNYLEDTISVVELSAESPFRNRMVLKMGRRNEGAES